MNQIERDELVRLAEEIANGRGVDWGHATTSTSPEVLRAVSHLRVIHDIARVHREDARTTWGPFTLGERIASGTYGEVYVAHDPALARDVALKLLRADRVSTRASTAFVQEARRLARVKHPHVVTIHGADAHDDRAGLWMELVRGRTLEEMLASHGPMSATEAARIGIDVCGALAAIHAAGLTHRDVKTSNIVRESGGRIVLLDLGAAVESSAAEAAGDPSLGEGTPFYLSSERLRGAAAVPRDDLFALGIVLFRLASGRYPVEAHSWSELVAGKRVSLRDVRPDAPRAFVQVVDRALSADPAERFVTAGEMERALAQASGSPAGRRQPALAAAAAATIVVAVIAGALVIRSARRMETAAVVPSPAATAQQAAPLAARATLLRVGTNGDAPLASGDRIAPGDALALTLSAAESVYAYVIDEDAAGSATVLFPSPGLDRANPLPPATSHQLPGSVNGARRYWRVTSAGGAETITVIASRRPLAEFESDIARLPQPSPGAPLAYASLSAPSVRRLRGIASLTAAPAQKGDGALGDALRRSTGGAEASPDVWTWQIALRNPSP